MLRLLRRLPNLVTKSKTSIQKRFVSDGSEPIPKMDSRSAGPKGAGDRPYEAAPVKQDGPPPGGFGSVRYQRHSSTVPSVPTAVILGVTAFMMSYGLYQVGETNKETRALKAEKKKIRENLVPLLQAESDAEWVVKNDHALAWEAELMKDVPGWVVGASVYHSKRWMPPAGNERAVG